VTFIATASKVAAIAVLCRLVSLAMQFDPNDLDSFRSVLLWMSVAAMTLGNLAALRQKDLKRLLGYSAVAHGGYVLIGLQTLTGLGLTSGDFADLVDRLVRLVAAGRCIMFLEGGYDLEALASSSGAALAAAVGIDHRPEPSSSAGPGREVVDLVATLNGIDE